MRSLTTPVTSTIRPRAESFLSGMASAHLCHDQLGKDVVEVMTRVQNKDDELKAQLASCVQLLGVEFEKFKSVRVEAPQTVVQLLDSKVREMQASIKAFKTDCACILY